MSLSNGTVNAQPRGDLREQLQATLGSAFTLEHELGGAGMSRVFAATETALGRRVVVKVLSPDLAEGVSADRFAREIRFAANLQQANIVPVLATGEAAGVPFYTMPFVEGLSLRERLRREAPLPVWDAVSILRDIARALAYAHDHGVVHRDIKPENVLLSGDAAVVTDFGIAKALSAARTSDASDGTLTKTGIAVGTPGYMAPEQVAGEPDVDHRVDIYAFGCVAYELLTGAAPFAGRSTRELFAAHLAELPVPLAESRRDCPADMADLVMRCLAKRPGQRPQSAREILATLNASSAQRSDERPFAAPLVTARRLRLASAVLILLAAVAFYMILRDRGSSSSGAPKSVAVLPLVNIGGDSTQEYLADGMTDELSTALGKVPGLQVASRSLARRYRGQRDVDVREVGRRLGVGFVLQGSVRRLENKIRVAAQLASAASGVEVWSDRYDRDAREVFALQDDIMRGVADALGPGSSDAATSSVRGTINPDAYDLYLRGRFLLERRGSGVRQAVEHFERAIRMDSGFARAHAGLSMALGLLPYFSDVSAPSVNHRASTAARSALALDTTLAEAHVALALAAQHAYDWSAARRHFQPALALAPREQPVHLQYARFLLYTNDTEGALTELELAKRLDPYSALPSAWLGQTLTLLGRREEGLAELRRALEIDSVNGPALQFTGPALARAGRPAEARVIAARLPKSQMVHEGVMGYTLALAGDRSAALRIARELEQRGDRWFTQSSLGLLYLGLGDTARALSALETAVDRRETWPSFLVLSDPLFDGVRQSARFAALLRRVHLDTQGFASPDVRPR